LQVILLLGYGISTGDIPQLGDSGGWVTHFFEFTKWNALLSLVTRPVRRPWWKPYQNLPGTHLPRHWAELGFGWVIGQGISHGYGKG